MAKIPRIREYYQVYTVGNDDTVYVGKGIEKVSIERPDVGFEDFLTRMVGDKSVEDLEREFPKTRQWLFPFFLLLALPCNYETRENM